MLHKIKVVKLKDIIKNNMAKKKAVDEIIDEAVEEVVVESKCSNCEDSGLKCSVCGKS